MRIFVSYRRDDTDGYPHELKATLEPLLAGRGAEIFIDVDNLPVGSPFAGDIVGAVRNSDVLLVLIGRHWTASEYVRLELSTALAAGVRLVAVLADGAALPPASTLPTELDPLASTAHVMTIRADDRFDDDVARLARLLEGFGIATRGGPPRGTLRMVSENKGWFAAGDRRYVRVNRRKLGVLIADVPHTDFSVPAGVVSVQLGRGLMWSNTVTATVRPNEVTSVRFSVTGLGSAALRAVD